MSGASDYWVATDELGFVRNRMRRLPSTLWSSAHRDDLDHQIVGTEHASVYASDLLLPEYRNTAEDATPEDSARFKRILKEHLAVYARDPQTARFLDKTTRTRSRSRTSTGCSRETSPPTPCRFTRPC
jgi:hypothetical protein